MPDIAKSHISPGTRCSINFGGWTFDKQVEGNDGWSGQQLFDWSTSFSDTFWLASLPHQPMMAVLPLSWQRSFASKVEQSWQLPWKAANYLFAVGIRLCFWGPCAMPPEGAPLFFCFNPLNQKGASAKQLAYGLYISLGMPCSEGVWLLKSCCRFQFERFWRLALL